MNANRNLFPSKSPDALRSAQSYGARPLLPNLPLELCAPSRWHTKDADSCSSSVLSAAARCSFGSGPTAKPELISVVLSLPYAPVSDSLEKSEMKVRVLIFSSVMFSFSSHGDFLQNTVNSQWIGAGHLRVFLQARAVSGLQRHKSLFSSRAC